MKTLAKMLIGGSMLIVAALAPSSAGAATCSGRPCINVGAFNIKLLGNDGPADSAAEYQEIGRLLATTMDLDVFSLEEINVRSPEWAGLKAELARRDFDVALESDFGGERDQYIVILYRRGAVRLASPAPADLDFPTTYAESGISCRYENIRPPVAASFRAGSFDFRLIAVHLKSQLQVGRDPNCDDRIRTEQSRLIARYIADVTDEERDLIVVGDFNSPFNAPENGPFRAAGFRSAMEDRAPGSGDISYVSNPRGLIDQIVFRAGDASYVRRSGLVYRLSTADRPFYLRSISDHVPIRASFYVDRDDD